MPKTSLWKLPYGQHPSNAWIGWRRLSKSLENPVLWRGHEKSECVGNERCGKGMTETVDQTEPEMRALWLVEQVRRRHLGFGRAAELAGMSVKRFLELMSEHQATPFDYDPDELAQELALDKEAT